MNKEQWEERYQNQKDKIIDHENRIKKLEKFEAGTRERMDNLIKSVESLTSTMRWFMGILVTSFIGFFFYFVQSLI